VRERGAKHRPFTQVWLTDPGHRWFLLVWLTGAGHLALARERGIHTKSTGQEVNGLAGHREGLLVLEGARYPGLLRRAVRPI